MQTSQKKHPVQEEKKNWESSEIERLLFGLRIFTKNNISSIHNNFAFGFFLLEQSTI